MSVCLLWNLFLHYLVICAQEQQVLQQFRVSPQQKHPEKQSASSFPGPVCETQSQYTERAVVRVSVWGDMCVKAEFLPMQFIRKIDICYPSWKTTPVSQSVLTKCLCAESYHTSIVLQPGSKPDHPWEVRGMVTSTWITLISLPLSDNCWETLIQIWIWRVFYSALTRIRKDQSEPDFHTSESVLTTDKTKVRWDLSDESNLASIKAGTILFQRNHHVFN